MHKYISLIFILLFNYQSLAVDLHDALSSAYNNNDELQKIRRDFLIEIEEFAQAFSEFMPRISMNMSDTTTNNKWNSQFAKSVGGANKKDIKSQQGSLTIAQPIFNGGGSVAALKAAQEAFRVSRANYYAQEQKIILDLITTYLDCYAAKEKYDISEARVKTNQQTLATVEEKLKLGEATTIDLATARANLSAAETDKLTNYANYQGIKASFVRKFGIEADNITLPTVPENLPLSLDGMTQRAILVNPNVDGARHNVTKGKASEMVARSALLPTVAVQLQQGKSFYDPQSTATNSLNDRSTTASISMNIPIYAKGGAEYSNIRKSKNATRIAAIQLDDTIKQIRANSIGVWENYEAAKSKIIATAQGVEAAQLSYDGTVQEEIVGSKTILDVLVAEDKLNEAKISQVDAHKQSILSAYQMKALVGELTAKCLKLNVAEYFTPEDKFKTLKKKLFIGF